MAADTLCGFLAADRGSAMERAVSTRLLAYHNPRGSARLIQINPW